MKEKVKRIILAFFCCLSVFSLSACGEYEEIDGIAGWSFYIRMESPKTVIKDEIAKIKLFYGHNYDSSYAESYYLDVLFEFKLSVTSWDNDLKDEKVIFTKNLTSEFIADQSNRAEISDSWNGSRITLKKYYEVEFSFADYKYEIGQFKYEFGFDYENGSELERQQARMIKYFEIKQPGLFL